MWTMDTLVSGVLAGTVTILTSILYLKYQSKRNRLPPGPLRLPLVGNIWYYMLQGKDWVLKLATDKNYPDIIGLYSPKLTVLLNSGEVINDVFVKQADKVSARRLPEDTDRIAGIGELTGGRGISETDGRWQPLRRLILSVFKDHGVGKAGMESQIMDEASFFMKALNDTNGTLDVAPVITQAISNVITRVVFGDRFDYSDARMENLQFTEYLGKLRMTDQFPFIKKLPGDLLGLHGLKKKADAGVNFARQQIEEHRKTLDADNPRDFIDSYLIEQDKNHHSDVFNDANLLNITMALYVAGTDTTSVSLSWAFLYLILYPEAQDKIYQEIQQVAGDRDVLYSDRHEMHYTMSFITEILRVCIAITSLPHVATEDIEVKGYLIPRGATVLANLWANCRDEKTFKHANKFKPGRHLDSEGKFVNPDSKKFIPFSSGRRLCPGEHLARMELFLFLVSTVRNFRLESEGSSPLSDDGQRVFVYEPKRYLMKTIPRT